MCNALVAPYLADLFNSCVVAGVFPDYFKEAKITPVFKKGSQKEILNYRPIGILLNLAKVFENLLNDRLKSFFKIKCGCSNNILLGECEQCPKTGSMIFQIIALWCPRDF